ncbi:MAG: hypothetical protein ACRETA_00430 [Gammaproteobacteria bacterium]
MNGTYALTADANGDIWIVNDPDANLEIASSVTEITASAVAAGACGNTTCLNFVGGGISEPQDITVDAKGNVWVANFGCPNLASTTSGCNNSNGGLNGGITEIEPGATQNCSSGCAYFTLQQGGNGVPEIMPEGVAVDKEGNIWFSSDGCLSVPLCTNPASVVEIPTATIQAGSCNNAQACPAYSGNMDGVGGIGVDASQNVWIAGNTVTEIKNGAPTTCTFGCITYSGFDLNGTEAVATDGVGNVWVASVNAESLTEITTAAVAAGSCGTTSCPIYSIGEIIDNPRPLAVDQNGDIWVGAQGPSVIQEIQPGAASNCSSGCIVISNYPSTPVSIAIARNAETNSGQL